MPKFETQGIYILGFGLAIYQTSFSICKGPREKLLQKKKRPRRGFFIFDKAPKGRL
jgi:hypothetical protein